jgi:LuxR family transcriptional regulator, maltose regulon positive regulatory protein
MLIRTKFHMPSLNARMIQRTHLVDRLSAERDRRLIVISGAAGSGKTSLVCQWINKDRIPVAWYSLDKADSESGMFFHYLLAALSVMDSEPASLVGLWLQKQKRFSGKDIIPLLIENLADLPEDIYLVLDDYHLNTSKRIHDALLYLLDHIPPKMHIVIISRYGVPFPMSHFKVRNQMVHISAEDMKFTEKETEQFFTEIIPVKLSTDEVHELARYTEGWVGGLQLLGLSLKEKYTFESLSNILTRARQDTTDYLIDEVITVQPKNIKTFLYRTALLDRFNVDVCREVTGMADTPEILDHVYRNNLFLTSLDTERKWYCYHHLFSEAIRKQLKISPDAFCEVHRKAALWFSQNDYLEDAFRHAFASGDFEFAADLLEDYLLHLYERYEVAASLRWLAKLPHEVFMQRPLLRLYECCFKIESFQLPDIEATLTDIEDLQTRAFERYEGVKKALCQDLFLYFKSILPCYRDPAPADVDQLDEALQRISLEDRLFPYVIKDIIASRHFFRGDLPRARDTLREASAKIFSSESTWAKMIWFGTAAYVERWQGHLCRAEAVLQEGFELLDQKGLSDTPLKFMLYAPMAWVFYFRNDLEKALEYGAIAMKFAEESRSVTTIFERSMLLAFIYQARGEAEKAYQYMKKIQDISKAIGNSNLIRSTDACIALLTMWLGDFRWTKQWVDRRKLCMDELFSFRLALECLAYAELLYRNGQYGDAGHMLETLRDRCGNQNTMEPMLSIDLLHSATLYALNDQDRAKNIMERALAFSESEGYIIPFVCLARDISPILIDMAGILSNDQGLSHLMTIMKACGIDRSSAAMPRGYGDLTHREIEILELLTAGLRDKEIAERAFVSLPTVKTHVRHIFEKLNVCTRVQAIRRAEELKILKNR